jgi:molybdopterin converting factor small subunit
MKKITKAEKKLQKSIDKVDKELTAMYEEYIELHAQLNKHRGKQLEETDMPEVNRLLEEIQDKFAQMYPVYYFIVQRHQLAVNVVNSYNDFIDTLKKAGAQQMDNKTH